MGSSWPPSQELVFWQHPAWEVGLDRETERVIQYRLIFTLPTIGFAQVFNPNPHIVGASSCSWHTLRQLHVVIATYLPTEDTIRIVEMFVARTNEMKHRLPLNRIQLSVSEPYPCPVASSIWMNILVECNSKT
jgi:hypothetical protein